jgi:UDP-N-acetylglucosamine acyltransferase
LIHHTAIIEVGAKVSKSAAIGAYAFIDSSVEIGDGTVVMPHACIYGKTTIGKNNRIFSHAVVGSIPQDLKFKGEDSELIIGDENTIREFTLINTGTEGGGNKTVIGNKNLLMGYVHVAHDCTIGDSCILANGATLAGHVILGNGVVVGGLTPVHQFVHIGDLAMLAGASAVSQDIPPYCLAEGNRAKLRGLNLTGLRRHAQKESIDALKAAYKELFTSGVPLKQSAGRLLDSTEDQLVKNLCEFVLNTTRGIPFHSKEAGE